jgi:flavin-dependent dehydrogenase
MDSTTNYDVIIAGGGPAGSSAAIHLATRGLRVLLAEQKRFPRAKLCGEFISPECLPHFERLGVADRMFAAGAVSIEETVFYSRSGRSVSVPSAWFGARSMALGLSRAEMDERLLRRASEAGVEVIEEAQVVGPLFDRERVCGVKLRIAGSEAAYRSLVTIDATGRARTLTRGVASQTDASRARSHRAPLVAFKAHLVDARVAPGACEIFFYRGGYGGLNSIESGLSNLCFIASASDVRRCGADAERVMRSVVCRNRRAAHALADARAHTPWLAVSLEGFGRHQPAPADGLLATGDAASFIDPFTGSGMLMALESGELAAEVIADWMAGATDNAEHLRGAGPTSALASLADSYRLAYARCFNSRLRVCAMLRRAAFTPGLAETAIRLFSVSDRLRRRLARATRRQRTGEVMSSNM